MLKKLLGMAVFIKIITAVLNTFHGNTLKGCSVLQSHHLFFDMMVYMCATTPKIYLWTWVPGKTDEPVHPHIVCQNKH